MDASCAAAAAIRKLEMNNDEDNGTAVPNGADVVGGTFAPSVWGDFFITYVPPPTKMSEELMRKRVEELKRHVRGMFDTVKAKPTVVDAVTLVDTLERLGIDGHFREEIHMAISHIHDASKEESVIDPNNIHIVATQFRLLRQHGIWVSTDVLDKFRDDSGNFSSSLSSDPRTLLSLYHAAHMAVPGDANAALDDAMAFTRRLLEEMATKRELLSPTAEQVVRALDHPLPRFPRQLEAMRYIGEYAHEEMHDGTLLELAKLHSSLMRSLHLRELKALSMWWRDLYDTVNLTYSRDRTVEFYFWTCGVIHEEEHSRARLMFAKTFGLASLLDDTYDVHANLEECHSLTEAIQKWDESAASALPKYLRALYMKTLGNFKEFEDLLEPNEKYRMSFAKKAYQLQAAYYLQEAQWYGDKYQPSWGEHEEVSIMSSGLLMLVLVALMGYDAMATQEVLEWTFTVPEVIRMGAQIIRLLNDVASYKLGKNKKDVASAVECYMLEKGVSGEEAVTAITAMIEHRWRLMNGACMEMDRTMLPAAQLAVNIARTSEVIYLRGRDGYTNGSDLKDLITALFLDPIPL